MAEVAAVAGPEVFLVASRCSTMTCMARLPLNVRISEAGRARLEELSAEYGVTMTMTVRAVLAVAFDHIDEVKRLLVALRKTDQ